jgi:hypothetical protein
MRGRGGGALAGVHGGGEARRAGRAEDLGGEGLLLPLLAEVLLGRWACVGPRLGLAILPVSP